MTTTQKTPAIIFDFGGVLVDWSAYYLYRKIMSNDAEIKAFLEEIDFSRWNAQFDGGYSFEQGVKEKCAEFPQYADLIQIFNDRWMETMGEVKMETVEIVRRLKENGYRLFGLSNWNEGTFDRVKNNFVFLDYLEDVVLSGKEKTVKPDAKIFNILLQRNNLQAKDCLFIDDHLPNIDAARALGFQAVQFVSASQLEKYLVNIGIAL